MKKIISFSLALVMLVTTLVGFAANAYADQTFVCGDNLTAKYESSTKTLTVSGTGEMYDYTVSSRPEWTKSNLYTVEKVVINEGVTTIGDWAFGNMFQIKTVSLPDSLTSIGLRAFSSCIALQNISIPANVESIGQYAVRTSNNTQYSQLSYIDVDPSNQYYCSVDGVLYDKDKTVLIQIPAQLDTQSLELSETVKTVSSYAGQRLQKIKEITIPESVKTIEEKAFDSCAVLEKVVFNTDENITISIDFLNNTSAVIQGYAGSYVESFANQNGIDFEPLPYCILKFVDSKGEVTEIVEELGTLPEDISAPELPAILDVSNEQHMVYSWSPELATVTSNTTYTIQGDLVDHNFAEIPGTAVEPTYETPGQEADSLCADCGHRKAGKEIPPLANPEINETSITDLKANENGFDVTVSKVDDATGYQVRYATRSDFGNAKTDTFVGAENTTLTVKNRAYGTTYNVQARTYKTVGEKTYYSDWTESQQITTVSMYPDEISITGVKTNENGFDVTVSKATNADGYEVRYATRSDFGNAKTDTYEGVDDTTLTVKNRAYGTKYNVQARAYKIVDGDKYYSDWSETKQATTVSMYPSSVSVTSVKANGNGFDVTVSKATNANGYEVRYATRSDFGNAKTNSYDSVDDTTLTVTGRAYDTPYNVQARAYKIVDGDKYYSAWTASKQVTTAKDPNCPASTDITSIKVNENTFDVTVSKVADATGYQVRYATRSDFGNAKTDTHAGTENTILTVKNRAYGTTYNVQVRTYKTVGNETYYSDWSDAGKATTVSVYPGSVSITSVKANRNGFDVTVSKATNANGYEVRYATRSDFGNAKTNTYDSVDDTTLTVTGRAYDTPYNVQVRAYKITVDGDKYYSAWTLSKVAYTAPNANCPAPTEIISVQANGNGFDVTVSKVADADGYEVRYATRSDFGNAKTDGYEGADDTTLTVTGRAYNTNYYVQARAYKQIGDTKYYSDWSDSQQIVTAKNS